MGNAWKKIEKIFENFQKNYEGVQKKQETTLEEFLKIMIFGDFPINFLNIYVSSSIEIATISNTHFSQVLNNLEKIFFHGFIKHHLPLHFI